MKASSFKVAAERDGGEGTSDPIPYLWNCPNGHEFLLPSDTYALMAFTYPGRDGVLISKTLTICPLCYAEWIEGHVPELKCVGRVDET